MVSPAEGIAQPKRIGDTSHVTCRVHQYHVEPYTAGAPFGVLFQYDLAGSEQSALLPRGERNGGLCQSGAGLHFDDRQDAGFLRDGIDLTGRGSQPSRADGPAIVLKCRTGGVFRRNPGGVGELTSLTPGKHGRRITYIP